MFFGKTLGIGMAVLLAAAVLLTHMPSQQEVSAAEEPASFSSYDELVSYIEKNTELAGYFRMGPRRGNAMLDVAQDSNEAAPLTGKTMKSEMTVRNSDTAASAPDYSGTNVQVQGVDEADLVKTDGNYLYIINDNKLTIARAYPVAEAKKLSETTFEGRAAEIFINKDRLVVLGNGPDPEKTFIQVYNVSDRKNPTRVSSIESDGSYLTSRMIGDFVYTLINTPVYRSDSAADDGNKMVALPGITVNGQTKSIKPTEIHYFNCPDYSYRFTTVLSLNTQKESEAPATKTFLTGVSQNTYVSSGNLYLTGIKTPNFELYTNKLLEGLSSALPAEIAEEIRGLQNSSDSFSAKLQQAEIIIDDHLNSLGYEQAMAMEGKIKAFMDKWHRDIAREQNKTVIHKLAIDAGQVEYKCRGEVGGTVLNQFSMDEHNGYFRIATTSEGFLFTDTSTSRNNIYVLDQNLQVAGQILGLAPTERIYSARFMGKRAYLVTFRQIDPLFVIDLKDPTSPKVLGELKIPGYSDYLHPYDANHLIGIGREVSTETGQPVRPTPERMVMPPPTVVQGVKIALFDVSDPTSPREVAKYVTERRDSDSEALRDHRAVLFSRDKNLLVIPITYSAPFRIMSPTVDGKTVDGNMPEYQCWQGAFAFTISPDDGIKLKGKVEHFSGGYYKMQYYNTVKRSLYIENTLYTISNKAIKINDLESLKELKTINLN